MKADVNGWLLLAAALSGIAAALHVLIVFGGAPWYRFFGAGEGMTRMSESGHWWPALLTSGIALLLGLWALYALTASGAWALPESLAWVLPLAATGAQPDHRHLLPARPGPHPLATVRPFAGDALPDLELADLPRLWPGASDRGQTGLGVARMTVMRARAAAQMARQAHR